MAKFCLLNLKSYFECSRNMRLPPRSYHLSTSAILFHCVSINKDENFIHRDYRPNIRYILFSCDLHFSLNVCCNHIHSIYSHHNCAVKYDHTARSGVYGLFPVNDNISKMQAKRCKIQIILKLSSR